MVAKLKLKYFKFSTLQYLQQHGTDHYDTDNYGTDHHYTDHYDTDHYNTDHQDTDQHGTVHDGTAADPGNLRLAERAQNILGSGRIDG